MPSKSKKQYDFIHTMRSKYKSRADSPKNMEWIWDNDWVDVDYDKLPEEDESDNDPNYAFTPKVESYKRQDVQRYKRLFTK